jgi:hypothetical protein
MVSKIKFGVILLVISFVIGLFFDLKVNLFIEVLAIFWILKFCIDLFSGTILKKKMALLKYREEVFSLVLLIPLFFYLRLDPIVYSFSIFGLTEILLFVKWKLIQKPIQSNIK